jgi:hypothetical protein
MQKPKGLLMTDFVTNLAETHLKNLSKSLIDHGHPCGLTDLILVAVKIVAVLELVRQRNKQK